MHVALHLILDTELGIRCSLYAKMESLARETRQPRRLQKVASIPSPRTQEPRTSLRRVERRKKGAVSARTHVTMHFFCRRDALK